ncbi:MAG: ATP-binding protein [Verrucomicrobiota bacterium]
MGWPLFTVLLTIALVALHLSWRRKFSSALAAKDKELVRVRELQQGAVRSAEARQQTLLDSMVEGLLLLDNEGRIQLVNRALENLFLVNFSIYGKTIIEAFRNHQLTELADRLQHERQVLGFEFQSSEIPPRWFQVNASTIADGAANPFGTVFVFHDLTRLKQLENTRQEFVANVSHELRTPLSMIKGYVETLIDGAKDNPEVADKFLRIIENHTNRLTYLIEDLLTISKLESGKIILNRQIAELFPAVEKVIRDLQTRASERNVTLRNEVPAEIVANADFNRLEQVLWNLIDNAIKYGQANGTVTVGASASGTNGIEVWVEDDGVGIPEEAKGRIFERFYRLDKARSREQGGTGLGLAIVKHVVLSHGVEVWVESAPGQGARFHFTLPGK